MTADGDKEFQSDYEFVKDFADRIREARSFDSVFIVTVKYKSGEGTSIAHYSSGNYHATQGALREYIV